MSPRKRWNRNTARQARRGLASFAEGEGRTYLEVTVTLYQGKPVTAECIDAIVWQAEAHLTPRCSGQCHIEGSWDTAQTQALTASDLLPLLESKVPELREFGVKLAAQVVTDPSS